MAECVVQVVHTYTVDAVERDVQTEGASQVESTHNQLHKCRWLCVELTACRWLPVNSTHGLLNTNHCDMGRDPGEIRSQVVWLDGTAIAG